LDEKIIEGVGMTVQALTDSEGTKVTYIPIKSDADATYEGLSKYIPGKSRLFHDLIALGYNKKLWVDKNVFYLSLNSSIGGTILIKDEVYYGNGNKAGEVGHLQLEHNGRKCYCGNKGCFDAYCNTSILSEFAGGSLDDFFNCVKEKKEEYLAFWNEYVEYLADAVFSIRLIFDGVIMIGGELGKYAKYYLDDLRDLLDKKTFFPEERAAKYVLAYEEGEYAIAVGAAMYYIENVLDEF
jgi:predicted NBD/HSP70 family sugar kinase